MNTNIETGINQIVDLFTYQLAQYKDNGEPVCIFLFSGAGLVGKLTAFDEHTLLLEATNGGLPTTICRTGVLSIKLADRHRKPQSALFGRDSRDRIQETSQA